jgi:alkylation response protein AidB-like acyl-CoA dehydrogenase
MSFRTPRELAQALRDRWVERPSSGDSVWPETAWRDLCTAGVTRWTIPVEFGGDDQPPELLLDGCVELARGELLVTFVLSQFQAACQRMTVAESVVLKRRWLHDLAAGKKFATVGISHLTTSRQHTAPAVTAVPDSEGFRLTGEIPWVTGCRHADIVVIGGTLDDGRQILAAVPTDRPGIEIGSPMSLLALTGSETGPITLHNVAVPKEDLIAGPVTDVIQHVGSGGAGSLMTSALSLGHALGCLDRLQHEAAARPNLMSVVQSLNFEAATLHTDLFQVARREADATLTPERLRTRSTDLALRSSQALLTATKGAGFVVGHPAERLCREALFFLVWSCPQAVATRLLQNFGGCENGH